MVSMHTDECRALGATLHKLREHVSSAHDDRVPAQPRHAHPQSGPGPHVVVRHMQLQMALLSSRCACYMGDIYDEECVAQLFLNDAASC